MSSHSDWPPRRRPDDVQAEVGYPPKLLARILRLRRAVETSRRDPTASIAETAAIAGYIDQAHLGHDCVDLAGTTPAQLLAIAR